MQKSKVILFSLIALSILVSFLSCESYEDDYSTSLLPAKKRLQNTWERTEVSGSYFATYLYSSASYPQATLYLEKYNVGSEKIENYDANYNVIETITPLEWKLDSTSENLLLRYKNAGGTWDDWIAFRILKLTEGEFWCEITNTEGTVIFKHEKY